MSAGVSSAIQGTDFRDAFIGSVLGDYAALSANTIGSAWGNGQNPVLHTSNDEWFDSPGVPADVELILAARSR